MDKIQQLIDQIKDNLQQRWEQIQETDLYIQLKEKYDNLSPSSQKIVLIGSISFTFIFIFLTPLAWYTTSQDNIIYFEDNKALISNMLEVSQEVKKLPPQSQGINSADLRMRMDKIISDKGVKKEQIISMNEVLLSNPTGSNLIPAGIQQNGVEVSLQKLTLKQITDLNFEFDRISPLAKTLILEMKATAEDVHYYDTTFKVASFSVPEPPAQNNNPRRNQ